MSALEEELQQKLRQRHKTGNLRYLTITQGAIDFASNDYLGFSRERKHQKTFFNMKGSTGSRLLTGNSVTFEMLEERIAFFHQAPAGLIFNSGYTANIGLLGCLGQGAIYLFDTHIHASMHDGMVLSRARCYPWRHNDLNHLETRLRKHRDCGRVFVLAESVYSCDGSLVTLTELCQLCEQYGVYLILDEAHATGIFGDCGEGLVVQEGCQNKIFARMHTFSKALGIFGAIVVGSKVLIEYLKNFSRAFIYTTALPESILHIIDEAYHQLIESVSRRKKLFQLISYFTKKVSEHGLPCEPSISPIQKISMEGNVKARTTANQLAIHGFDARALLSPTVQRGHECLRVCLHAFNTHEEIDELMFWLRKYV